MKRIELLKPIKVVIQTIFPIENVIDDILDSGANRKEFKDYLLNEFSLTYANAYNLCQSEIECDYIEADSKTREVWFCNKQKFAATPYQEERINLNWNEIENLNIFFYSNKFIPIEIICNNPNQKSIVRTNRIESWEKDYRKDLIEQQFDEVLNPTKDTRREISFAQLVSLRL